MSPTIPTIEISDAEKLPIHPLVSVYMLAYNHEQYLAEAIEAVLAQKTDFSIELIIGEDCSNDGTKSIAIGYQRKHPSLIRVLTAAVNVGARKNAERCRRAARGQYIAICEGDDYWTDISKLYMQVRVLEQCADVSLVCHAAEKVDALSRTRVGIQRPAHVSRLLSTSEVITGDGFLIPTCSIVARAGLVRNLRPWRETSPVGDYPLVLQACSEGRIAYLDRMMGVYRVNVPGSWTSDQTPEPRRRQAHARLLADMLRGFLAEAGDRYEAEVQEIISRYMFGAIVRNAGPRSDRKLVYDAERRNLTATDRLIALASVLTNRNLGWMRTPGRSLSALIRTVSNDLTQPRLRAFSSESAPP